MKQNTLQNNMQKQIDVINSGHFDIYAYAWHDNSRNDGEKKRNKTKITNHK